MSTKDVTPKTLLEVVIHFADERTAWEYMRNRRWPNGVSCPRCECDRVHLIESRMIWRCNGCRKQFSVKVGTIFEDSPIKLSKWIPAMWLIANAKNGISSYELHRALGVTQKTAWFMLHRIRLAMQQESFEKMGGKNGVEVEVDETFIGANARNIHQDVREAKGIKQGSQGHRSVVLGMIERDGSVRTFHVEDRRANSLVPLLKKHIHPDSWLYTDSNPAYVMLPDWFRHEMVDHAVEYVNGRVSTNCMENYWSLLKRTIRGTYVSVEPFHLHRYLDEQAFRFNERKGTDASRFKTLASQVSGKRLTYKKLTGKEEAIGY
ncbi:IS1595 family transposase [Fimbriimonas ginsengisoli]|uniref:Putative transposase n=1 Tax=Fimbriimonas ginsengisoli Gsoil 348 TaxID=661478 RepID=A0A068NVX5_FIMGI|nr:IS1595 family transposase [Fimbriimonas ginsengisoli]AIE85764.1 putative transposase [Fimbriimonas ginsengisoli Gsoil 348]